MKIVNSFPNSQFSINGHRIFQCDRNCLGWILCSYVEESITGKQLDPHGETTIY